MFGLENMIKDMIAQHLNMTPEELQAQIQQAIVNAQQAVQHIINQNAAMVQNQKILHHQLKRQNLMLESIMRDRGIEIPAEENPVNGNPQLPH